MVTEQHLTMDKKLLCLWLLLLILLAYLAVSVSLPHSFISTYDQWFENLLYSVRSPLLLNLFGWITSLGDTFVVAGMAGIISIFLLRSNLSRSYVAGLATSLIGAGGTAYVMKEVIARARPGGLISAITETSFSFPSGHATVAVALYGFLAYILCKLYPTKRIIIVTAASIIIVSIGFSRLYLGVHFPSDVVAGYTVGGLWLLMGIWIAKQPSSQESPHG